MTVTGLDLSCMYLLGPSPIERTSSPRYLALTLRGSWQAALCRCSSDLHFTVLQQRAHIFDVPVISEALFASIKKRFAHLVEIASANPRSMCVHCFLLL